MYRVRLTLAGFELTVLVVIGTDCIGLYKPNYHTVTTAPTLNVTAAYFIVYNPSPRIHQDIFLIVPLIVQQLIYYCLTFRCDQAVKHYPLTWTGDVFKFGHGEFSDVDDLLHHFTNKPLIGSESGQYFIF